MTEPATITFGSLFAGIGGFDLGFERAGMVCKWQVEIDGYATKVLEKHWPTVHRERDIRECGSHNLERVDVICGGFPCQDISYAGRGAGLDGERSGLFFEAVRLVRELQPRVVVLENVAALLTRGLDRVLGTLAEIGFDAEWHCIPAASVGAPHIRDRVFVLGYNANSEHDSQIGSRGTENSNASRDRNGQNKSKSLSNSVSKRARDEGRKAGGQERSKARTFQPEALRQGNGAIVSERFDAVRIDMADTKREGLEKRDWTPREWTQPATAGSGWWTVEPNVGRVANGVPSRVDRLRGLGNAVVPQVAEYIGRHIVEALK